MPVVLCCAVDMPQLRTLELMRLGVRMLPRSISRLTSLTCLTFSGEMMRSVQLPDEVLQLTNLKVRVRILWTAQRCDASALPVCSAFVSCSRFLASITFNCLHIAIVTNRLPCSWKDQHWANLACR